MMATKSVTYYSRLRHFVVAICKSKTKKEVSTNIVNVNWPWFSLEQRATGVVLDGAGNEK